MFRSVKCCQMLYNTLILRTNKHVSFKEAQSYGSRIDVIQIEIDKTRSELKELRAMQNDAEICKETSVTELRRQEETVYSERKKREIELQKMKKEAEEKKIQHERIEKRLVCL